MLQGSGGAAVTAPAPPAAPYVTLYDQYNNAGADAVSSQDFETANNAFDDQVADDFVIPGGQDWQVTEVDIQGQYFNGPGPAASMNVFFYTNSGTLPILFALADLVKPTKDVARGVVHHAPESG